MSRLIEGINHPRRLPIFFLVQNGYSMKKDFMDEINAKISSFFTILRQDPYALEAVHLCVLTLDEQLETFMPLTSIAEIDNIPEIAPSLKNSLKLTSNVDSLIKCIDGVVVKTTAEQKGDWKPFLFVFTNGEDNLAQFHSEMSKYPFERIIFYCCGNIGLFDFNLHDDFKFCLTRRNYDIIC